MVRGVPAHITAMARWAVQVRGGGTGVTAHSQRAWEGGEAEVTPSRLPGCEKIISDE